MKINEDINYTPRGSVQAPVYERVFDEDLKRTIVKKTKMFDIDEFIQASVSTSDLAQLRQEMAASGLIPQIDKEVIDYSLFPQNIHELNQVVSTVQDRFNALPDSIKKVFGSADAFQASLIQGNFEKDISTYYQNNTNQQKDSIKEEKVDE